MMTEYIKREDLLELYDLGGIKVENAKVPLNVVIQTIKDMPSADVVSREDYEGLELVCKNYEEALKDAVDELTMTGWINVKDRLPSKDGEYLVAYKLQTIPPIWQFEVLLFALDLHSVDKFKFPRKKYKGKSGFYFYDSEYGDCEDSRVTHWMPLPENPKEIENG